MGYFRRGSHLMSGIHMVLAAGAAIKGVTLSPTSVVGFTTGAGVVTTETTSASPYGLVFPYTYAWSKVSGDTFTISNPTASFTAFSVSLTAGQTKSGTYRCTATDTNGATAFGDVSVYAESF